MNIHTIKNIGVSLFLAISFFANAQTGPGGVGSTDGTSDLRWWYDANTESYTDGAAVSSAGDLSGYIGNSLSAAGTEQPTFRSALSAINNKSAFDFDNDDELESTYVGNSNETMSYIVVMNHTLTDANVRVAVQQGGRNTVSAKGGKCFDFVGGTNHTSGTSSANSWIIHSQTFAGGNNGSTVSNGIYYYNNGLQTDVFNYKIENRTSNTWIGGNGSGGGTGLNGQIAEAMKFTKKITVVERTIIENYLSAKYDISISNDKYAGDDSGNGNYDNEVIGIGIESTGSHTKSNDVKGLTIEQNSGFTVGEYLFAGNNVDVNENLYTDIGGVIGLEARWKRIWYFDITGSGNEAVNITFDISEGGFSGNAGTASNYRLLYRSGTSGNWTDAGTASSVSGDQIIFSNNSISNGDGYYTIGTFDYDNSPLPIQLLSFDAVKQDSKVVLNWQTATESNNDFFTIERSTDGNDWEAIAQIDGAGNSNEIRNYQYVDQNPLQGISYYRLKQTDFDGVFSYSKVQIIKLEENKLNFSTKVVPNPAQDYILLKVENILIQDIQFYSATGENVTLLVTISKVDENQYKIDLYSLQKGVYVLRTPYARVKVLKQ